MQYHIILYVLFISTYNKAVYSYLFRCDNMTVGGITRLLRRFYIANVEAYDSDSEAAQVGLAERNVAISERGVIFIKLILCEMEMRDMYV